MTAACLVCGRPTTLHGETLVRGSYAATFLRCTECGFICAENPTWLAEAYAEPINLQDTGYVERNLSCRDRVRMFIELYLNPDGQFLDHAAGYGLFVRLMRDMGYDFRWSDLYCANLFARGFEAASPSATYDAVTAFEVFEHLVNPMEEIAKLVAMTECLIFTTRLVPVTAPKPGEWWYYGLEHGQHVSFYTRGTLRYIARRLGYHLLSDRCGFHALTRRSFSERKFSRLDDRRWRAWIALTRRRESKVTSDYEMMTQKLAEQPALAAALTHE